MKFISVKIGLCMLTALICVGVTACQSGQPALPEEPAPQIEFSASLKAEPQEAVDEIYKKIDIREVAVADDKLMEDTLGFDLDTIDAYYVRYSSGRYGLADVYMIRPAKDKYDAVREKLEEIKYNRITSTESYDVLDAHKIAQNAEIFQYGGYLVMLMLADNAAAEAIIEQYIPSTEAYEVLAND